MGIEAQEILSKTLPWSENFYNMTPEEIMEYHIANNTNRIIYIDKRIPLGIKKMLDMHYPEQNAFIMCI